MTQTLLTADMITNETLRIMHQKLNFIGTINRAYDDSFASTGAKIGSDLRIRLPNQYTVTSGAVLNVQDTAEEAVTLQVTTQKHVGMRFSSQELALDIDKFSERYIEPAASVLAANIEADAMSMYKDVYNQASQSTLTAALDIDTILDAKRLLDVNLAPNSPQRTANLCPRQAVNLVSGLKALFHDTTQISKQYLEGEMGITAGFKFFQNSLWARHTSGTDDATGDYLTNDLTAQTGAALVVDTGAGTFTDGDIITIEGVYRVHPETKASSGELQQFVVTAAVSANATSIPISPSIVASGAKQNVSNGAADGKAITKVAGASKAYDLGMVYHKDAFTFATADLVMPSGVDFASRKNLDGISLRVVRDYDINNDNLPCRIDVLYGYKAIRPEFAARVASKQDA